MDLFDKLVTPILNYGGEVWRFCKAKQTERVHLQFCKHLLGVKQSTQNNFEYGDFGRTNYQTCRYIIIVKYWLKIIFKPDNKLVTVVNNPIKCDVEGDDSTINWVVLVRKLLCDLVFHLGVGGWLRFLLVALLGLFCLLFFMNFGFSMVYVM